VSCIYGLGSPKEYLDLRVELKVGDKMPREQLLRKFTDLQYVRAAMDFKQGMFHVLGDTVEVFPPGGDSAIRLEFWDQDLENHRSGTLHG
jgi:excinuclease ABC subunit B